MLAEIHAPKPDLQNRISAFVRTLRRKYPKWVKSDPSGFRAFVLGTMKATLPRQRPGRKSNPIVEHANRLYKKQRENGGHANWHSIAGSVTSDYVSLAPAIQRSLRRKLRAQVHSYRHSKKQRACLGGSKWLPPVHWRKLKSGCVNDESRESV